MPDQKSTFLDRPGLRAAAVAGLWAAGGLVYGIYLFRPYAAPFLWAVPRYSLSVAMRREPLAAAGFLLWLLASFLCYGLAYRLVRGRGSPAAAAAVVLGGLLCAGFLASIYPVGAIDVFNYAARGEMLAQRGLNPMVYPLNAAPDLPSYAFTAFRATLSPRGPIWTWLEAVVAAGTTRFGLIDHVLGLKGLAILGYALACGLIALILHRRASPNLTAGLLAFAWNPLVLFETAVNAHADIWIGALILGAVLLRELRRPLLMLAALTLAALIKVLVAPLLPLFAVAAWQQTPFGQRRRLALTGALTVLGIVAAAYLSLPEGFRAVRNLAGRDELFTNSLPAALQYVLTLYAPKDVAVLVAGLAALGVFAAYVLVQVRNAARAPASVARLAFNTLVFLLLVCMTWMQPWYWLWVLPLAAVYPRRDAVFQAALSMVCVALSYVVYGYVWHRFPVFHGDFVRINLVALATSYALPWAYAVWSGWRGRRGRLRPRAARPLLGYPPGLSEHGPHEPAGADVSGAALIQAPADRSY
jgi:hypothetical protein